MSETEAKDLCPCGSGLGDNGRHSVAVHRVQNAGGGDAGDDGEGVVRDVDVDGLEVVGARAADGDRVAGDEDDARRYVFVGLRGGLRVVHGGDLGEHGHSPLSDRWAGIANRGWTRRFINYGGSLLSRLLIASQSINANL